MASVHQCRFKEVLKGDITADTFSEKMRTLVNTKDKAEEIAEAIFDEIDCHVAYDDYHLSVNDIFKTMISTEECKRVEESVDVKEVYKLLWNKVSKVCSETAFTVFLGASEDARLNPLLKELKPCVL